MELIGGVINNRYPARQTALTKTRHSGASAEGVNCMGKTQISWRGGSDRLERREQCRHFAVRLSLEVVVVFSGLRISWCLGENPINIRMQKGVK